MFLWNSRTISPFSADVVKNKKSDEWFTSISSCALIKRNVECEILIQLEEKSEIKHEFYSSSTFGIDFYVGRWEGGKYW